MLHSDAADTTAATSAATCCTAASRTTPTVPPWAPLEETTRFSSTEKTWFLAASFDESTPFLYEETVF